MKYKLPKISKWLLSKIQSDYNHSPTLGDLEEEFHFICETEGVKKAKRWFHWQVLISIPSFIKHNLSWSTDMFRNYFKITLRAIKKQKIYSFINLAGLSLGLVCFILITLWAKHEMSYDQFHINKDRTFRILNAIDNGNFGTAVSYALGPELKVKYPEVEESCRIWPWHRSLIKYQDKNFDEFNFYLADPSMFTIFTFPFIKGNPETALSNLNSIVITEETAQRYFGEEDPIGKVLQVSQPEADFIVTGVIKNIPSNSHLQFDLVARVEHLGEERIQRWEEWVAFSYVLLQSQVNKKDVEEKIAGIYHEHLGQEPNYKPVFQPLTKVYLYEYGKPGLIKQVTIFSLVAIFILILACINFMNLSTARSTRRAKEVGIRKTTGGTRSQLVKQFLGESLVMSYFSLILALVFVQLVLPYFNSFTGKELKISQSFDYLIILTLFITPLTALLAGFYPAIHLSSFKPIEALKDKIGFGKGRMSFRKILVVFQFSISIGLIAATLIVSKQLHFIRDKGIGVDRHHVVTLINNPDLHRQFDIFKNQLEQEKGIIQVTAAAQRPTNVGQWVSLDWDGREDNRQFPAKYTVVDYDFFKTFNMEIIEGRVFSKKITSDFKGACIVNESFKKLIGDETPLGKQIYFDHPDFAESDKNVQIIGVVKDFHSASLHSAIQPFLFRIHRPFNQYIFIKINPDNIDNALANIERKFKLFSKDYPYWYQFLDEAFESQYQTEKQLGVLFQLFGAFAIFISCLGLFGLAAYTAEQKTKEIGVRKVLGATFSDIILLLSKQFTKWILLANLIAWPVSYILMTQWLNEFAYRINIGVLIFITSALIALFVAMLSVSYQAIKAAIARPVESLRYE